MKTAVDNAFLNFSTNVLLVVVSAFVSLWMTPYLIDKLGVDVYGVVPLFTSILSYLGLLTTVLSASIARYVSINYYKGDIDKANVYLSSSFWTLTLVSLLVFACSAIVSFFLNHLFSIPEGYASQARWLFLFVIGATLIAAMNSLYGRSCFILHRFYWLDFFGIAGKLVQVGVLLLAFTFLPVSLVFVGWAAVAGALVTLVLTAVLDIYVLPELKVHYKRFDLTACKEMLAMGAGVSFNQFGALLYLNSDLIIINICLGSTATGYYGPIVQWVVLVRVLAGVVTRLFGPVVMELIAKQDMKTLSHQLLTLSKFLGLILGLPVFLLCGFSKPLLMLWLGADFAALYKLMILLVLGQIVPYSLGTIFGIFKGLNKLRLPGIVTLAAGVGNIILSVILVKYTPLGIYGAGIATVIAVFGKSGLFNVIYVSRLMRSNPWRIWSSIVQGCTPAFVFTAIAFLFAGYVDMNSLVLLVCYCLLFAVVYSITVFYVVLRRGERLFVIRVLKLNKFLSPELISIITR